TATARLRCIPGSRKSRSHSSVYVTIVNRHCLSLRLLARDGFNLIALGVWPGRSKGAWPAQNRARGQKTKLHAIAATRAARLQAFTPSFLCQFPSFSR